MKNAALCTLSKTGSIVEWRQFALPAAKRGSHTSSIGHGYEAVASLLDSLSLTASDHVLLEAQMSAKLKVLCALAFAQATPRAASVRVIDPRRVKGHFGTSAGSYRANKEASVRLAEELVLVHPGKNLQWRRMLERADKKDDLADAFLQARYWHDVVSGRVDPPPGAQGDVLLWSEAVRAAARSAGSSPVGEARERRQSAVL
jgi:hypothetical protein